MKIIYDTEEKILTVNKERDLLTLCLKHKIDISHSCEGMASCGTCRVIITSNIENLSPRNELEAAMASDRCFKKEERLACQLALKSSLNFKLPED
jgi:ferredoxin, 2Fe-2S